MERLKNIDILKFIGLMCIILAHVSPPNIIFQIRNFDVILMMIVSITLFISKNNTKEKYFAYLIKRIKRLIIPTYIFLILFFSIVLIIAPNQLTFKTIIDSFLLRDGIGYVWVIRIYIILAALLPIVTKLIKIDEKKFVMVLIILYFIYELYCYLTLNSVLFNSELYKFIWDIVGYIVPCILTIYITYFLLSHNKKRTYLFFSTINIIIFIIFLVFFWINNGNFENTNIMKYPFRIYYLSYAYAISALLLLVLNNKKIIDLLYCKIVNFISKHSLWFYLWHILFIYMIKFKLSNINWFFKYIIVIILTSIVVFIQSRVIKVLEKRHFSKKILSVFKG